MSLLNPKIQEILRQSGLSSNDENESLTDRLNRHNLSLDDDLEQLSSIAHGGETDTIKLRAVETSLKIKGVLKEQAAAPPSITINIIDDNRPPGVNPILIPREFKKSEEPS